MSEDLQSGQREAKAIADALNGECQRARILPQGVIDAARGLGREEAAWRQRVARSLQDPRRVEWKAQGPVIVPIPIELTYGEVLQAKECGMMRKIESMRAKCKDPTRLRPSEKGWDEDVEGAAGEEAFAKAFNCYWGASVNSFKAPDIPGTNIQIRTRLSFDPGLSQLMVRPWENKDEAYVLVRGRCPKFEICGWIYGEEAMQERWLGNKGVGRTPCYWVPHDVLYPLDELIIYPSRPIGFKDEVRAQQFLEIEDVRCLA